MVLTKKTSVKSASDTYAETSLKPNSEGENEKVKSTEKPESQFADKSIDELMEQIEKGSENNKGYIYKK